MWVACCLGWQGCGASGLSGLVKKSAKVYLVGAGPGDIGLFTLRGIEVLRRAETVIYDGLIQPELLRHISYDLWGHA